MGNPFSSAKRNGQRGADFEASSIARGCIMPRSGDDVPQRPPCSTLSDQQPSDTYPRSRRFPRPASGPSTCSTWTRADRFTARARATRLPARNWVAEAIQLAGIAPPSDYWRGRAQSTRAKRDGALLALGTPPTAIFCATDIIALGAHKAASKAGLKLGTELSLLGCDDIEMNTLVSPELTSISVPQRELGALAVRQLIQQLDSSEPYDVSTHILPVKLSKRGTTGRLRRR